MALQWAWNPDHLFQASSYWVGNIGISTSAPFKAFANGVEAAPWLICDDTNPRYTYANNTVVNRRVVRISGNTAQVMACMRVNPRVFGYTTGKMCIGVRIITATINTTNATSNRMISVSNKDGSGAYLYRGQANREYMFEFLCDFDTEELSVYVDGTLLGSGYRLDEFRVGSLTDTTGLSIIGGSYTYTLDFTDFYLNYDAPDDPNPLGRLGNIKVLSGSINGLSDTTGFTNVGDLVSIAATLNQSQMTGPNASANYVRSGVNRELLNITYAPPAVGTEILGVVTAVTALANDGAVSRVRMMVNGKTVSTANLFTTRNTTLSMPIDTPPSGGASWTPAEIANLVISVGSTKV